MTSHSVGLRKFLQDSALTFSQQLLSLVLGFTVSIISARSLGRTGVGILTLTLLFSTMVITFVSFGVPAATIYLLGSKKYKLEEVVFSNLVLSLIQSILGLSGALIVLFLFKDRFFSNVNSSYLYWIITIIPISLLNTNLRGIFQAVGDFRAFNITTISRVAWTAILLVVLVIFRATTIFTIIFANILASFLTLALILYFLRRHVSFSTIQFKTNGNYLRDNFKYGIKVYISSVFTFFNYKQDRFLLNAYLSPSSVGVYNVGANLGEKLWLVSQSVSIVLFPKIASLEDDEKQRRWMTPFITRHLFMGTAIAAAILFWITPFLIRILYGDEFSEAASVLQIILPGVVFLTISRVVSNDISGRGRPGINTILSGFAVIINLLANILLIPSYGIKGAAWASTISYIINTFLKVGVYSHIAHVSLASIFIPRYSDLEVWRRLIQSTKIRR